MIEHGRHGLEQGIVIRLKHACSGHDGRKPGSFRNWNPAHVQLVNQRA